MNKEEIEAAEQLINTPITPENVDEPVKPVFPKPDEVLLNSLVRAGIKLDNQGTA